MNFPDPAISIQAAWKSRELLAVACELVEAGLRCLDQGVPYFGPDDIPENFTADGQGLTGSATKMLLSAKIIDAYYGTHLEANIFHGRRKSKRDTANGRKIFLYQIVGRGLAEAFLKRNGAAREPIQRELAI